MPVEHKEYDELHVQLMMLLDRIEINGDATLASERFDIMERLGYEAVEVAIDSSDVH